MSRSSAASRPSSAASKQVRLIHAFAELPFVAAVRVALPWSLIGLAVAAGIMFFLVPVPGPWFGVALARRVSGALVPGFSVMAAVLAPILAWCLAERAGYDRAALVLASVASFALALPRPVFAPDPLAYLHALGAIGLFLAMAVCGATGLCVAVARRAIPAPQARVADWVGAASAVALFSVLPLWHVSIAADVTQLIEPLARLGDSYPALMAIVVVETLLWTAGIHGPASLAAIVTPVYLTLQVQNTNAYAAHAPLPHIVVVSLFLFVFPGGAGATLPLAALLAISRVAKLRRIGRLTLLPSLFNINEPLIFGIPIVFNPFLALPFVLAPAVLATVTYVAVASGWVARAAFYVPSALPTPVSTYLATLDPRALVLVAVNLALATAIYFPFVRAYERHVAELAAT